MKDIARDYVKTKRLNKALGQEMISVRAEMERLDTQLESSFAREARLEIDLAREKCLLCRLRHWWLRR